MLSVQAFQAGPHFGIPVRDGARGLSPILSDSKNHQVNHYMKDAPLFLSLAFKAIRTTKLQRCFQVCAISERTKKAKKNRSGFKVLEATAVRCLSSLFVFSLCLFLSICFWRPWLGWPSQGTTFHGAPASHANLGSKHPRTPFLAPQSVHC